MIGRGKPTTAARGRRCGAGKGDRRVKKEKKRHVAKKCAAEASEREKKMVSQKRDVVGEERWC